MSRTYKDAPKYKATRREQERQRAITRRAARRTAARDRQLGRAAILLAQSEAAARPTDTPDAGDARG